MVARPHHLLLVVSFALLPGVARADDAAPGFRCGTPAILHAHAAELRAQPRPPAGHLLAGPKQLRDGFGTHTVRTSANFAVNTGANPITDQQAQLVLDTAETSWAMYVDALGFGPPAGTDTYLLNIYVSWTDDNPSIDYDGGYATLDNQGYPYLVISKNLVRSAASIQGVVSHEFFHDFQLSLDAYYSEDAQWYWEATAEWGAQEVYPALADPYAFVGALALTQELPLYFFGDPFATDPTGQHQYGAGLFPRYLSDRIGDPGLIPTSWTSAGSGDDPLQVLDGLLPAGAIEGGIDGAFSDFAAHDALWDYPQRNLLLGSIASYEATYPTYHQQIGLILAAGTDGFVDPAPDRPLHELGSHVFTLSAPVDHVLDVAIEGGATGTQGTAATWTAQLVRTSPTDGIVYTDVPFDGGTGALSVTLPADETSARLVVEVHGHGRNATETFPYQLRIGAPPAAGPDAGPGPDVTGDDPGGCCSTGGGGGGSVVLALGVALALGARRRRG